MSGLQKITDHLIRSYERYYNVHPKEDARIPELQARCDLHMTLSNYILMKKNVLWEAGSHEYCYIFEEEHLSIQDYRRFEEFVLEDGMKRIKPGKGHMCSALTMIVICKTCDADARKALKKCRHHKNFRFSLDGWMDMRTALLEVSSDKIHTNLSGHDNRKVLKGLRLVV